MADNLGILAYGSLIEDPGAELEAHIIKRIPIQTPFPVEYARRSRSRGGAPTLVKVPPGHGSSVAAYILVLDGSVTAAAACDMLYRREINKVGQLDHSYDEGSQRGKDDAVVIESLALGGIPQVLYTVLQLNFAEILNANLSLAEKAEKLAKLARNSVTAETYAEHRDGIRYLADAIRHGIVTPLTEPYKQAILHLAGRAADLEAAREYVAKRKKLKG
ncbi:MAG: hypothetical protein EXR62_05370 [Chloroflexi bacterium]|nr:hypothetical protein [Chloroflexota bacterium]